MKENEHDHLRLYVKSTRHVLTTQNRALYDPSDLFGCHPSIEWIKRDDVCPKTVESLSVDFEMVLVTGSDSSRVDFVLWVWLLNQYNRAESCGCREADI